MMFDMSFLLIAIELMTSSPINIFIMNLYANFPSRNRTVPFSPLFLSSIYTTCSITSLFTSVQLLMFCTPFKLIMALRNFQGDEQLLFDINEKRIIFIELRPRGYNLLWEVRTQEWKKYFVMLNGIIFPNLVEEFWMNALVPFEGNDIRSSVFGHSVRINGTIIANEVEFRDAGASLNDYLFIYDLYANLTHRFIHSLFIIISPHPQQFLNLLIKYGFSFSYQIFVLGKLR